MKTTTDLPAELVPVFFAVMALLAGLVWYFGFRPARTVFEHSIILDVPRERVFAVLSNLQCWKDWLPRGPGSVKFEGSLGGKGAMMLLDDRSTGEVSRWDMVEATEPSKVVVSEHIVSSRTVDNRHSRGNTYPTNHEITIETGINSTKIRWVSSTNSVVLQALFQRAMAKQYQAELEMRLTALKAYVVKQSALT